MCEQDNKEITGDGQLRGTKEMQGSHLKYQLP